MMLHTVSAKMVPPAVCSICFGDAGMHFDGCGQHAAERRIDAPRWRIRPIADGVTDESRSSAFVGTLADMDREISRLHRETGMQHVAREARS